MCFGQGFSSDKVGYFTILRGNKWSKCKLLQWCWIIKYIFTCEKVNIPPKKYPVGLGSRSCLSMTSWPSSALRYSLYTTCCHMPVRIRFTSCNRGCEPFYYVPQHYKCLFLVGNIISLYIENKLQVIFSSSPKKTKKYYRGS